MLRNSYLNNHIISKQNKGYSYTKYKLKYDNNIIKKKMNEIKNKTGPYNIKILRPDNETGLQKSNYNEIKKLENITQKEKDKKFKKRLKSAKASYSIQKMKKSNAKLNDYKNFFIKILRRNREYPFIYQEFENILN